MPVIKTSAWLNDFYDDPLRLCKKLQQFFPGVSAGEIFDYFQIHGMYNKPVKSPSSLVKNMKSSNVWMIVEKEHLALQKKWSGPDIPIIILPSNTKDMKLMKDTKGKAGLAFSDKLILFVPETISSLELKALFVHEYNHVCRIWHTRKAEKSFTLLDSIILEGIAEQAVLERLGESFTSSWTKLYSRNQLESIWNEIILPEHKLKKSHPRHNHFLYGWKGLPKMSGYCVGYYLVEKYIATKRADMLHLLEESAEEIAGLATD